MVAPTLPSSIGWVSCSALTEGSDTRLLPDWPGWCCSAHGNRGRGPVSAEQPSPLLGGAEIQGAACRGCKLEQGSLAHTQLKVRWVSSWSPRALRLLGFLRLIYPVSCSCSQSFFCPRATASTEEKSNPQQYSAVNSLHPKSHKLQINSQTLIILLDLNKGLRVFGGKSRVFFKIDFIFRALLVSIAKTQS